MSCLDRKIVFPSEAPIPIQYSQSEYRIMLIMNKLYEYSSTIWTLRFDPIIDPLQTLRTGQV